MDIDTKKRDHRTPVKTMEPTHQQQETHDLIDDEDVFSHFRRHGAAALLNRRNLHLGSLLTSERAEFYLNILYRLLLFKRDYELEPLYDDIYHEVRAAQSLHGEEYHQDQFRNDLNQLDRWDLVESRIEKQRLRGYRDNRKRKFRYRLRDEAVYFLEWLEQRRLDDMQSRGNDTRDLLGETRGSLGELLRLLHHFKNTGEGREDTARRVLFQLFRAGDLCQEISAGLADFNGRLLFFLVQQYQIDQVRGLILEIESYVETFLRQTYSLRGELLPLLQRLQEQHNRDKILACHQIMEAERLRTPNLMQARRSVNVAGIPENLRLFFAEQGGLDRLLTRINGSAMHVWQKLRSHLRELERKNNRLQDIRQRQEELASLPEDEGGLQFITELLSQPASRFDPAYWDSVEKAEPPEPRKRLAAAAGFPRQYLRPKKRAGKAVESMDEARLKMLENWLLTTIPFDDEGTGRLSAARFDSFADFTRVIELARAGLLAGGRRLARLDLVLTPEERRIVQSLAEQRLDCPEMTITSLSSNTEKPWK